MQKTTRITAALVGAAIPVLLYAYSSGPDPRKTGAPGDQTCAQSGCHTGTSLNGGGGNVQLTSSTGTTYTPGQQQTFTITINDSSARAYGFQMTARLDGNGANGQAGDFTAGPQQVVICDDGRTKGSAGCASGAPVQFIEHSTRLSTKAINVAWAAPSSGAGAITIYVAANAANGDGNDTGDHIYTTKLQLTASSAGNADRPSITSGGVTSASAFKPTGGIAPGTWLEIFGSNLSGSTRGWQSSDFSGNDAPASLDGVGVTVGGKSAFIDYVSPGQVNVQVPDGIPIGPAVPLVLTNSRGQSDPYILPTTAAIAPALLAPASFVVDGKQYAVATFPAGGSGVTYVGNTGAIGGVTTKPAKVGEVITFYGIGFGPVSPATGPGVIATAANTLGSPATVCSDRRPRH